MQIRVLRRAGGHADPVCSFVAAIHTLVRVGVVFRAQRTNSGRVGRCLRSHIGDHGQLQFGLDEQEAVALEQFSAQVPGLSFLKLRVLKAIQNVVVQFVLVRDPDLVICARQGQIEVVEIAVGYVGGRRAWCLAPD